MKILLNFCCIAIALLSTITFAQDFQGKATYQSKTVIDVDLAGSGIPADRVKQIKERMKSQLEKTYILTFDKTASIYKEEKKLDQTAGGGRGGFRMLMAGGAATGKFYKNTKTKTLSKENEFSGKNFLIKGDLTTYEWKMEQETKMIGDHLCFKATTVVERPVQSRGFRFGRRNNNEEEEKEKENEGRTVELVVVTAWYAMDIPVAHGPGNYWGLPGLILEIDAGNTKVLCTKIVLNPKEKEEIEAPKKGKVVSQEEYDKIIKEKIEEMRERFRNERQKGGQGGGHTIRLRG